MVDAGARRRGATLIALLVVIAVMGVGVTLVAQTWTTRIRRENEAELLFRGLAYKAALESYASVTPAGASPHPERLEDLLVDDRFANRVRHLRRLYPDPMTGAPFAALRDSAGRIRGVASTDRRRPLKRTGFPDDLTPFELADQYSDWRFLATSNAP